MREPKRGSAANPGQDRGADRSTRDESSEAKFSTDVASVNAMARDVRLDHLVDGAEQWLHMARTLPTTPDAVRAWRQITANLRRLADLIDLEQDPRITWIPRVGCGRWQPDTAAVYAVGGDHGRTYVRACSREGEQ